MLLHLYDSAGGGVAVRHDHRAPGGGSLALRACASPRRHVSGMGRQTARQGATLHNKNKMDVLRWCTPVWVSTW
eukprot:5153161-Prymnesium_polylepis.1